MSFIQNKDFALEVARGNIAGVSGVNKFGRNGGFSAQEDLWDVGGTFVAPTTARLHDIVSTSASDSAAGVGARTIRVFGLTGWGTAEVSEDITMNGVTNVPTVNSYVVINRMQVLTKGATDVNVGVITATAQTDATVSAQINAGAGQTRQVIYGIPSTQTLYLTDFRASLGQGTTAGALCNVQLLVNPEPDVELTNFLNKERFGLIDGASSSWEIRFNPYLPLPGPSLIKMAVSASANAVADGAFDGYLVNN